MKIGVIGAGTASAIAILTIINSLKRHNRTDIEIYCISDPSKPTTQVGESTSGLVHETMRAVLEIDFAEDLEMYDGTMRYYTNYFWADANGNDFTIYYDKPGLHLNSDKWSEYIFKKLGEKYDFFHRVFDEITEINQFEVVGKNANYDFDYIIDCTGSPNSDELNSDAYITDVFQSVNSVILYPHFQNYKENNTFAYVHKNGWMFGVPLTLRKAFGYCYNNSITSYQEAVDDFSKIKGINASTLRNFSWKPYRKTLALDGKILAMGNKLYLFEPQQAMPLHYYALVANCFIDGILHGAPANVLSSVINKFHDDAMEDIQNLMALNYCGENTIDSNFWKTIKLQATNHLKKSPRWQQWLTEVETEGKITGYSPVDPSMMKSYIKGFNIDLSSLKA
jgi:Tryptophan halogenase